MNFSANYRTNLNTKSRGGRPLAPTGSTSFQNTNCIYFLSPLVTMIKEPREIKLNPFSGKDPARSRKVVTKGSLNKCVFIKAGARLQCMQNNPVIFNLATSSTYTAEQTAAQVGKISGRFMQLTNLLQRILLYWHHFHPHIPFTVRLSCELTDNSAGNGGAIHYWSTKW